MDKIVNAIANLRAAFVECGLEPPVAIITTPRAGRVIKASSALAWDAIDERDFRKPGFCRAAAGVPVFDRGGR